jgi:predicted AAA+ superfamily ATPase
MEDLFSKDSNVSRIIVGLELYFECKINPDNTLLIFDEVQEVPKALTSLKYFNENAPEYHIICAGSLLGVALHEGTSFPVGKVEFLDLYPLTFAEFLHAVGKEQYASLLEERDYSLITTFKTEIIDLLRHYYYIGGMPEVVYNYSKNLDFNEVRKIQNEILDAYEQDFSKHAPPDIVPRIRMIWNSIPSQLSKENKKFIYGQLKEGARAKDYELALLWLVDCGLVHKVHRVNQYAIPLKSYEDLKAFKLFILDVGLLSCMVNLKQNILLEKNNLFKEFKGSLTEQYVLQELKVQLERGIYYWSNERNTNELDFLIDTGKQVIPLEVKAEVNLQSRSLKAFVEKYSISKAVRTSMTDYHEDGWLINLPLYAISHFSLL